MATSIGEKLRLAREARGIALRDISEQTRISMRYLEAIESDDYKRLPGGIFNRSFIRAYAKHVGYDETEAISEYASMMREQGESADVASKPHRSLVYTEGDHPTRSPLMTFLLAIIILVVLSLLVWAALHFYQQRVTPKTPISTVTSYQPLPDQRAATTRFEKVSWFSLLLDSRFRRHEEEENESAA